MATESIYHTRDEREAINTGWRHVVLAFQDDGAGGDAVLARWYRQMRCNVSCASAAKALLARAFAHGLRHRYFGEQLDADLYAEEECTVRVTLLGVHWAARMAESNLGHMILPKLSICDAAYAAHSDAIRRRMAQVSNTNKEVR